MQRLNFTLDNATIDLLNRLSSAYYGGNKSQTVRAALESLASHTGHEGWVIAGYTPVEASKEEHCHSCGEEQPTGAVLYRPVFERGQSAKALNHIPSEPWVECSRCVEKEVA